MCELIDDFNDMPQVKTCEFDEIKTIIIEKYSHFLAREIITGKTFPIVDISKCISKEIELYLLEFPFNKYHTFIFSKFDKVLGKKVDKKAEIEKYYATHLDKKQLEEELTKIIKIGEGILDNKKHTYIKTKKLSRTKK